MSIPSSNQADDALLRAQAEVDEAWTMLMEMWLGPQLIANLKPAWTMTDKNQLAQEDPEMYDRLDQVFRRSKGA